MRADLTLSYVEKMTAFCGHARSIVAENLRSREPRAVSAMRATSLARARGERRELRARAHPRSTKRGPSAARLLRRQCAIERYFPTGAVVQRVLTTSIG